MPKKKLTKAQVKKKISMAEKAIFTIWIDKVQYGPDSFNPMSQSKTEDLHDALLKARRRI